MAKKILIPPGAELIGQKAELCPELAACLVNQGGYWFIQHPLMKEISHPDLNAYHNFLLEHIRTQILPKAEAAKKWAWYIKLHARPFRVEIFAGLRAKLTDKEYWQVARSVWEDSENIHQSLKLWREILTSDRPQRHCMMDADERAYLAKQPERLTVYRGYSGGSRFAKGWSWTLSKAKGQWFRKRFENIHGRGGLTTGKVSKANVIAYLDGRDEQEIIADPKRVRVA